MLISVHILSDNSFSNEADSFIASPNSNDISVMKSDDFETSSLKDTENNINKTESKIVINYLVHFIR